MLKAISLFTGAGGLDFGFEAAGFQTRAAVELDPVCCRILRLNRRWPVLEGDLHAIGTEDILHAAGLRRGEVDILVGGPPCQPFSKSGYWVRGDALRLADPRAETLTAFLRVVREALPRVFVIENAPGLAYKGKDEGLARILTGIKHINRSAGTRYEASWRVIDAADFGVPQHRERVFVIASREGRPFQFPSATHGKTDSLPWQQQLEPYCTAWDAFADLPQNIADPSLRVGGKWANLLPSIPEGENYLWHTPRGGGLPLFGWRTRYWSFLLKLAKDRPSWTIQAQPGSATGPFHWRNRKLSPREMSRLQTLPDGLVFDCGRTDLQRMLGNAVPSLVAEILGREIRRQLLDKPMRSAPLRLLLPRNSVAPRPHRTAKVPREFLSLRGHHADHPGEGKGAGARARQAA